ncbi:MAG: CinA family nicotinamide mononucleotide deamidase-related protein [Prevotella sp.]|jgi:nicotinamide-nucleotide amidase|nr:CinA family nicotinamide mononucleotide deamidase-related protein [Prevotella sp.]
MHAAIITIGDEILIGQIVDTNSAWIAQKMTQAGFEIIEMASIGDNAQQIKDTVSAMLRRADVILMTGGLGPTKDDITRNTLCEYFGTELVFDPAVLENIRQVFPARAVLNELTRNQAYVPKDAAVIQNRVGTAPVTWFERNGKVLVSLPGVPYEMRYNMENEIIPRLRQRFESAAYVSKVFLVTGYAESALAIHIADFENSLPEGFGLAYLPSPKIVKLRLFVRGEARRAEFEIQAAKLKELLGKNMLAEEDIPVEKFLSETLKQQGLTIGVAESCTGGRIAHLLTAIPGASACFKGGVVAYFNEIKSNVLQVPASTIQKHGAVSEPVVVEMARGTRKLLGVDCVIAVSGVAGPDGGTDEKPVGTVWVATAVNDRIIARRYGLGIYRESNIAGASNVAMLQLLDMLR